MSRIVLMVPLRRCGSNALRLRLNLHPDFYSPYPLHVTDMIPSLSRYGDLEDDTNYFRLIVDVVSLQNASLIKWPVVSDPLVLFDRLKDEPRNIHRIIGELYLLSAKGKKIVMDKSQDSVVAYREMVSLFPNMLFLDVVRDPRAQVSSMNRSIIYDFDTLLNTKRWVESRKWVEKIYDTHPEKIMSVRYEDFIRDQDDVLGRICAFFGIAYIPSIADISRSTDASIMSSLSPLWETNASSPDMTKIDNYMRYLSLAEIEHIENATLPWMRRFGYAPITPSVRILEYPLTEARARSDSRKTEEWKRLKKTHARDYILRLARTRLLLSFSSGQ